MIKQVAVRKLNTFLDKKGSVKHMLKHQWPEFVKFGEIYFSTVNPRVIKGWKKHQKSTLNYAVPEGNIKVVIFDDLKESNFYHKIITHSIGTLNHVLLTIPPNLWYSFSSLGNKKAIIANFLDIEYSKDIHYELPLNNDQIPYKWD